MTHVSVVVPLYNARSYIGPCIESVLAQTFSDWELIVVDDGSTDDSYAMAARYAQRDERIRLLHHPGRANRGVSQTRRLAMLQSRGSYLALLDADDLYEPTKLEHQVVAAACHPECVVFHTAAWGIDSQGAELTQSNDNWSAPFNAFAAPARVYQFRDDELFLRSNRVLNSSTLIRAEALRQVPYGFEQLFQYEDWALWVLLSGLGPFYVQPDPLVRYRMHAASATARVVQSPLVGIYSHIEFLLSVLALCNDAPVRQRAVEVLREQMAQAVNRYGTAAAAANTHWTEALEFAPHQPARRPRRRWFHRWLRRAA